MDEEPTYVAECLEMVKSFDLENNISFLGFQNIDTILPKSGLLTLTSISEGMPLVILEGFAAGLPCVSTDVGSCSDLIHGALDEEDIAMGSAGETTPIANPMMLAEHYIRFLDDETLWKEAQKSALKRVEKYYQEHLFLDSYKNLYERIL
jgi:glycosyltransferase involved in cell wall biosynthesis